MCGRASSDLKFERGSGWTGKSAEKRDEAIRELSELDA